VMGNIRESYSVGLLLGGLGLALAVLGGLLARPALHILAVEPGGFGMRTVGMAAVAAVLAVSTWIVDTDWKEHLGSPARAQLAGNGVLEFFRAFRDNEIDFQRFYATLPTQEANARASAEFAGMPRYRLTSSTQMPIERWVSMGASQRRLNVILVSVESLGAEFVESLGGKRGLTPELEGLARKGLYFTHLYATGTRTVRGLEALTLSVPPTPGHAIPMRPNNTGLFTLGGVFREQGYDAVYMYGGYSYFDNMREFFGGNGYDVIDRTDIPKARVTHETIWGVADEDLFGQAITEVDGRVARGKNVFLHVMTTSNHRPFTYPDGRIDMPSGSGRDGAVKYTDYAIGRFIREASARPWFADTVFVIVADHTSIGRGKTSLATAQFHIPMVIYSPKWLEPRRVDTVASQIDVAPTILGLLNVDYRSQFFGRDILHDGEADPHVFIANYQTVGFLNGGLLAELKPRHVTRVLRQDSNEVVVGQHAAAVLVEGISLYQVAADRFSARRHPAR
ncbi:MAG: LTA synthase family protein, partial [Usitatibacter sp.]